MLISRPPIGDWLYKVVTSAVSVRYASSVTAPGLQPGVRLSKLGNQVLRVLIQIAAAVVRIRKARHHAVADRHIPARVLNESGSRSNRHHRALVIAECLPIVRMEP